MAVGNAFRLLVFESQPEVGERIEAELKARSVSAHAFSLDALPERRALRGAAAALFKLDSSLDETRAAHASELIERFQSHNIATVVWGAPQNFEPPKGQSLEQLGPEVTIAEVIGRLITLARYAPLVRRLDQELNQLERLGHQLTKYFNDVDREMRLAGRLQRDFLPKKMPEAPNLRFSAIYRPAAWVSGDIYDVFRIDENHAGIFLADAMGHGTAAGLMTMFLRRGLEPKDIEGNSYRIRRPSEVMAQLHETLAEQNLPNGRFVTAAYAIIDTDELVIHHARGGHPYGLVLRPGEDVIELRSEGALLGLADLEPEFHECAFQLQPQDKLLFYTDGIEDVLITDRHADGEAVYSPVLRDWASLGLDGMMTAIEHHLDGMEGSLNPEDDVSIVAAEVVRD